MQPTPSLDTWTSGFLIAVAMGLFLALLLFASRNKKNYPIAFLVLAFSVILFQYVLFWTRFETVFPYLTLVPPICYYTIGPLFLLYFMNLYGKEVKASYALHFIPALALLIPNIVLWAKYLDWTETDIPLLWLAQQHWFIVIHMVIYLTVIILFAFKKTEQVSEYSKIRHRWSLTLSVLFSIFIISYAAYYILVQFSFFNNSWDYMISISMSLSIYIIGFFIFRQPQVFNGEFYHQLFIPIENEIDKPELALKNYYKKLTRYMDERKPYAENELRLVHLADQLGYSTHLLSKVINKESGKNFNQFINLYRLEEAKKLLSEASETSIQSIYFDVGFNNKTTFNNEFKKKFGMTPTQYRTQMLLSKMIN